MDEVVRRACDDDCSELRRLETLARAGLEGVRGGALRLQECSPVGDWSDVVADPAKVVLVGTLDDNPVAFLLMHLSRAKDRGLISHVYVEVEGRELGLGDSMVQHAVDAVRGFGLSGIEAIALPGDRDTKNLFERAGLTARKLTVYKSLRPSTADGDAGALTDAVR